MYQSPHYSNYYYYYYYYYFFIFFLFFFIIIIIIIIIIAEMSNLRPLYGIIGIIEDMAGSIHILRQSGPPITRGP